MKEYYKKYFKWLNLNNVIIKRERHKFNFSKIIRD